MNDVIAGIVTFLAMVAALQNSFEMPLGWKLVATTFAALIVLWRASRWFATWSKPKATMGFETKPPPNVIPKIAASSVFLAIVCAIFGIFALIFIDFYVITVDSAYGGTGFTVRGAIPSTKILAIQVPSQSPSHKEIKCFPIDRDGDAEHRANVVMIDWDTANRQLKLSNFSWPQLLTVRCDALLNLDSLMLSSDPPSPEVFFPARSHAYFLAIFLVGGTLWILALGSFAVFYRRA